jgi:CRISPR system Cascade subunit CasE
VIVSEWIFDDPKHELNDYYLHQKLWTAFNKEDKKQERPFLFRSLREGNKLSAIMLSHCEPEELKNMKRKSNFAPVLEKNNLYRFILRANAIKRLNNEDRCRVPLISQVSLIGWLERKLAGAARISFIEVNEGERLRFKKNDNKKGEKCTVDIARTDYSGTIECIDKNSLYSLICKGIGPAKGFGCGLLLLGKLS